MNNEEEKFFEESLTITESLLKEKKVWTDLNKEMKDQAGGKGGSDCICSFKVWALFRSRY